MNTKIIAVDYKCADNMVSNDDLVKIMDTSDEWITTRTGIKERRVIGKDTTSTDLGIEAAKKVISRAENNGFNSKDIDLIIAASSAPEDIYPSVACLIQGALNLENAAAFDLRAACSGFLYSLKTAKAFIKSQMYKNILIVATDATTKYTDWNDRSTCVLFGDGAGAAIVCAHSGNDDICDVNLFSSGSLGDLITLKIQGENCPLVDKIETRYKPFIQMKGKEVYKYVMQEVPPKIEELLKELKINIDDIDYFIPHQSNQRMIDALAARIGISQEKVVSNISKYGNMSAASIPTAIREGIDENKIKLPATILLSAFGAGMTSANAVIKLEKNI